MFTGKVRAQRRMETVPGYLSVQRPLSLQSALLAGQFHWYLLQLITASHVSFPQNTEGSSHCVCSTYLLLWLTLETGSQNLTTSSPHSTYPKDIKSEKKERKKNFIIISLVFSFQNLLLPFFLALLICCLVLIYVEQGIFVGLIKKKNYTGVYGYQLNFENLPCFTWWTLETVVPSLFSPWGFFCCLFVCSQFFALGCPKSIQLSRLHIPLVPQPVPSCS